MPFGSGDARRRSVLLATLVLGAGCARPAPERPVPERPSRAGVVRPALPPIPRRTGPLALDVVYPEEGAHIAVRDSTFVFGSTGTGAASLTINGTRVAVQPNGAFLAFLPVPADGVYRFSAATAERATSLTRRVVVPPPPPVLPPDSAVIVEDSIFPRGAWVAIPGERIDVRFQGTPGGTAALILPAGERIPLVERAVTAEADAERYAFERAPGGAAGRAARGVADYVGYFDAVALLAVDTAVARPTLVEITVPQREEVRPLPEDAAAAAAAGAVREARQAAPPPDTIRRPVRPEAMLELVIGRDTARAPLPLNLALLDPQRPLVGRADDQNGPGQTTDGTVIGRPGPGYTYHYFWPNGTMFALTGERNGEYRVRLAENLSAWVPAAEVRILSPGTPPPDGSVGTVRMTPTADWVDVRFELDDRLPFRVDEGDRSITVTLYGGTSDTNWLQYGALDPLIERAEWSQPADGVYRLTLHLSEIPWGYHAFWAGNGDLVVRVRRPPEIDPEQPLRGLIIAVDAGHPPGGAIGPTRLTEAAANLAIALKLRPLLERAGARVYMTRTDTTAVPLYFRPLAATEVGADVLVSIHNNAFPDGVDPFVNNGTSAYYFHRQSIGLARAMQRELLRELRLRDLGIGRGDLALVRPTWMPSVLTETMFLMIPRQEAALRDPEVQERIARAHYRGLVAFLRARARPR